MSTKEHHIQVRKTARYCTNGDYHEGIKMIWLVCHGYGQLARKFIGEFSSLDPQEHWLIAPEALSRFYWKGFSDKPAASWMTSEDRLYEIDDYIHYLDQLYHHIMTSVDRSKVKINILGFSQGTATASRWAFSGQCLADHVIMWGGNIAHDLNWTTTRKRLQTTRLWVVHGDNDPFLEYVQQSNRIYEKHILPYQKIVYSGGHSIPDFALQQLVKNILAT